MNCDECVQFVPLYLDAELAHSEREDLERHCIDCESCRSVLEEERVYFQRLRHALRKDMVAPAFLRQEVRSIIKRSRSSRWKLSLLPAASMVAAALLMVFFGGSSPQSGMPPTVQASMLRSADLGLPLDFSSNDQEKINRYLSQRLPYRASLPRAGQGMSLRGVRLTYLRDAPAAMVRYDLPGHTARLYIFRDHQASDFISEAAVDDPIFHNPQGAGRALIWRSSDLIYSLVSDAPEATLRKMFLFTSP